MRADYEEGYAFILEGDTEREFYMAFLEHLCQKNAAQMKRTFDEFDPDIIYELKTKTKEAIIKFNIVGSISQVPRVGNWVKAQCIEKYHPCEWYAFLCYDQDDYKQKISKFYEGDWKTLRDSLSNSCEVIDVAAMADIEDVMLSDIKSVCAYLDCDIPEKLKGTRGKIKLKNLFRENGTYYHEGKRARPLIDCLDMELLMTNDILPLKEIEKIIFK